MALPQKSTPEMLGLGCRAMILLCKKKKKKEKNPPQKKRVCVNLSLFLSLFPSFLPSFLPVFPFPSLSLSPSHTLFSLAFPPLSSQTKKEKEQLRRERERERAERMKKSTHSPTPLQGCCFTSLNRPSPCSLVYPLLFSSASFPAPLSVTCSLPLFLPLSPTFHSLWVKYIEFLSLSFLHSHSLSPGLIREAEILITTSDRGQLTSACVCVCGI